MTEYVTKINIEPVEETLRFEVFERDRFVCQGCEKHPPRVMLECGHVVLLIEGGSDDIDNLITYCVACNMENGESSSVCNPSEKTRQIDGYKRKNKRVLDRVEKNSREIAAKFCYHYNRNSLSDEDFESIMRFVYNLSFREVVSACQMTVERKRSDYSQGWRYFCGICWKKIRSKDEI